MLRGSSRRSIALGLVLLAVGFPRASGQAPTIEESGIMLKGGVSLSTPGSMSSLLGPMPGSSGITFGMQPGRDDMIVGRVGLGAPRAPTSIATPGGVYQGPQRAAGITAPKPAPIPPPLRYGTMELPTAEDQGPPDGLTIDQAIEILVHGNLDLRAKFLEIPQARADVLTASLRANPIFYADGQLVPYGTDSVRKPDGPTQYDINVSHPLDYIPQAAGSNGICLCALKVLESAVSKRGATGDRKPLWSVRRRAGGARGHPCSAGEHCRANEVVRVHQELYEKKAGTSADVDQAKSEREIAEVGLIDAQEVLLKRTRVLGEILNLPPEDAEHLELRGKLSEAGPPLPAIAELYQIAQDSRPDVASFRLGRGGSLSKREAATGEPVFGRVLTLSAVHISE